MAESKKSIIVYADWITKFEALNDEEAGRLIKHFFRYVNDKNPKAPDRITELSFIDIELSLKRDLVKWFDEKEVRSQSGIIGNLKRWHFDIYDSFIKKEITLDEAILIANDRKTSGSDENVTGAIENIANIAVNVSVSDSVNVSDIKKDNIVGLTTSAPTVGGVAIKDRCQLFIDKFNSSRIVNGKKSKYRYNDSVCTALKNRLKKYEAKEIFKALKNALADKFHIESNFYHLTPEYILREKTLEKYLNIAEYEEKERGLVH